MVEKMEFNILVFDLCYNHILIPHTYETRRFAEGAEDVL